MATSRIAKHQSDPLSIPERFLASTPILDINDPGIRALVRSRGWAELPESHRIGAIYGFVRDDISFGYNADDDVRASEVLSNGFGQCNTKATLLMALLRAVGLPCRFHGAAICKQLQKGVVNGVFYRLAPEEILHSWVEVYLAGRWVSLEGVILDVGYLDGLRKQFPDRRDDFLGYGVGTNCFSSPPIDWTGNDTAIQMTGVTCDYGLFDDPDAFYEAVGKNLSGLKAFLYRRLIRHRMNRTVARIRNT